MTLQQKKVKEFKEALAKLDWFRHEMKQYVKDGDLTEAQAQELIEDMVDQLDL